MANASAPPFLFGSAGQPLRRTGKQGHRSQGVRSQNRSGLDEFYFRNAGLNSDEARKAAMDIYGTGMQMTRGGLEQSSVFNRPRSTASQPTQPPLSPRERFREKGTVAPADGIDPENFQGTAKVETFKPAPKPQIMPATASDAASGRSDYTLPATKTTPEQKVISSKYGRATYSEGTSPTPAMTRDTFAGRNIPLNKWFKQHRVAQAEKGIRQTPITPREQFRKKNFVASTADIDPENLRDMAKVDPFKPAPKPQIMPATASDAASGRVDTMGPGGSPSQITSKYGTASVSTSPRKGKAMTRDTFAGRNIPLKEWLRQRRAAQAERGIA